MPSEGSKHRSLESELRLTTDLVQRLRQEHALLEEAIEALNARVYLNPREQMERKRLQKMKLLTKDRMQALRAEQRH